MQFEVNLGEACGPRAIPQITLGVIDDRTLCAGLGGIRKLRGLPAMQQPQKAIITAGRERIETCAQRPNVERLVLQYRFGSRDSAAGLEDPEELAQGAALVGDIGEHGARR